MRLTIQRPPEQVLPHSTGSYQLICQDPSQEPPYELQSWTGWDLHKVLEQVRFLLDPPAPDPDACGPAPYGGFVCDQDRSEDWDSEARWDRLTAYVQASIAPFPDQPPATLVEPTPQELLDRHLLAATEAAEALGLDAEAIWALHERLLSQATS